VSGTDYIAAMVLPFTRPPPPSAILLSSAARGSHIAIAPGWNPGTYTWLLGGNRRCGLAKPDWTPGSRPRNARSFFLLLPHSPFVAGGDGGGSSLGPGGGRGGPKVCSLSLWAGATAAPVGAVGSAAASRFDSLLL